MSDTDEEVSTATLASTRSRRDNAGKSKMIDRKGSANKFAALKKLKEARQEGRKMNYEVEEVDNVYDVVDENEYADRVSKKRKEDWIVDDDGGYIEDGREIFDEEYDDGDHGEASGKSSTKTKVKTEKMKKEGVKSSNIKNMLLSMPSNKKSENHGKLEDDELLGDILTTIASKSKSSGIKKTAKQSTVTTTKETSDPDRNPFLKKSTGLKKVVKRPAVATAAPVVQQNSEDVDHNNEEIEHNNEEIDMDGFDDDMDFEDIAPETAVADKEPEVTQDNVDEVVEDVHQNRGFAISVGECNAMNDGQWVSSGAVDQVKEEEIKVDCSSLPTINVDGDDILRMYWLDAHEDPFKHPGTVWLFGKVAVNNKSYVSCCVTVKNVNRRIYLAKREINSKTNEPVSDIDLYNEFHTKVAKRYKITDFKCRPVQKLYAFEHTDIPDCGTYLEVLYSSQFPALPSDVTGETFSRVFGTPQTSLETFLLDQKIKGPGWLDISSAVPVTAQVSWCLLEATVNAPKMVKVSSCTEDMPPLTFLSLKLGTVINTKTHQNEVTMAGVLVHTSYSLSNPPKEAYNQHFCLMTRPHDEAWPFDWGKVGPTTANITDVKKASSERELLSLLLLKIQKLDPDVIIGHDVASFDLEVLTHRMVVNKIPHWSRLGRLRRSNHAELGKRLMEKQATVGRLVADLKISAKELIRCKSYELGALVEKCLREGDDESRMKLTPDTLRKAYGKSEDLKQAIMLCMRDADQTLRLMIQLQALPLAVQISQIVGTVLSKTLRGGRAERIEYLLLHAFTQLEYIIPDKQYGKKKVEHEDDDGDASHKGRKKPSYTGGLVLEPMKGFYDKFILLLDFNSLYPSIIQEYNICFTTVQRTKQEKTADGELELPPLPDASLKTGVLPTQIKKLVDSRREVKNLLKGEKLTAAQKSSLHIRQLALKLTANSMYGCLGFSHSRFFAKPLAALVTSKGREILLNTRDLIQKMNLDVIYGDTDSVMVNTNSNDYEEVFRMGRDIKQNVNKLYKLLELDIDGVYRYMLLLKKKKYAAVMIEKDKETGKLIDTTELKGLDIVRRDWSQLAADAGRTVISIIMSDKSEDNRLSEIQSHLENTRAKLMEGQIALKDLAITKSLTKDPSDYADKKALPHVQVALRMNSSGGKKLKSGDTVEYVICEDGSGLAATQRAYHVDEVKASEQLKIDTGYYLSQQLHPVVSRLTEPIEGMSGARVAACLGLDPDQYKSKAPSSGGQDDDEELMKAEDRYRYVDHLNVTCVCGEVSVVSSPTMGSGRQEKPSLAKCPAAKECGGFPLQKEAHVMNAIDVLIRKSLNRYYAGWLVCEDPGCTGRSRCLPLQYLGHILDISKMKHRAEESNEFRNNLFQLGNGVEKFYIHLKERLDSKYMKHNAYATVSLSKLFEGLGPSNNTPSSA